MNHWRKVAVVKVGDRWQASGEYVCASEGGIVYPFKNTFERKEQADYFVSAIR